MLSNQKKYIDKTELNYYKDALEKYQRGDISEEQLQVIRLQQGVYGQRQTGVNMIRVKLPGGRLAPNQLTKIADVLDQYSKDDFVSITTRQDIQLHSIRLQDTHAALVALASVGLTTREACGNTVRNICACPLAGVCAREHVDVQTYVEHTTQHFLRHALTQHMPRKFKMSFSGCELDCAQGKIHDLGVVAVKRNNRFGFKILAGGGLGHKPHAAIVIESFIEESELIPVIEAIIAVHNKYSDRKKRAKSRIKFLVDRFGAEGFIQKYRQELQRSHKTINKDTKNYLGKWQAGVGNGEYQAGAPRNIIAQKQPGLVIFPISVPLGDLTAIQLRGLTTLLLAENLQDIRATQDQNLIIVSVVSERIKVIRAQLSRLGLSEPLSGDNVVACPGTLSCRLGITSSRNISVKIGGGPSDLRIRVSGCHNGCAQPSVGDIGIHGEAKRFFGKLIPHYRMYFGGDGRAAGQIARLGPEVPAARIDQAILRVQKAYSDERNSDQSFAQWNESRSDNFYRELLSDLINVEESDIAILLRDHGDSESFKVLKLGGGECAGSSVNYIASNFSEAAHERTYLQSFLLARKYDQAIDCAEAIARLVGQSLLFVVGVGVNNKDSSARKLEDIADILKEHIPSEPSLHEPLSTFSYELDHFDTDVSHNFDLSAFQYFLDMLNGWTVLSAHYCQQKNSVIDLAPSLPDLKVSKILTQKQRVVVKREITGM